MVGSITTQTGPERMVEIEPTGMAAANALGEKLPMFVIEKSAKPRCFSGVRNIPCRYRAQKKLDG